MKKLAFGLMRLPMIKETNEVDIAEVKIMADRFIEHGFTYFDTAACYIGGKSETAFREAVAKRYPRDSYTITDKLSLFMLKSADEMEGFFERQLTALGVDYIDYYLVHSLGAPSYKTATEWGAFDFVKHKKAEGKVRHIGFSFHDNAELLEKIIVEHPEVEFVQLQINYLDWLDTTVQSKRCLDVCIKHNKKVLIMEPVKGGSLVNIPDEAVKLFKDYNSDMSVASFAIRFAASCPNVVTVLSGMSNTEQLNDNISYMENFVPLNESEYKIIEKATKIIKESITVPCTACRYCVDDCPAKIAIPDYFSVYNNLIRFGEEQRVVADTYFRNIAKNSGLPSACIKCGKCESVCPQHIEIRKILEKVAKKLEK